MVDPIDFSTVEMIYPYGPKLVVGIDCSVEPSVTKQSFAAECDINNIMAKFERTGVLDFVNDHEGQYGDATALDYHAAMSLVAEADSMFADMPAPLRSRFENDPAKFLAFMDDPRSAQEIISLGLGTLRPVPAVLTSAPAPSEPVPIGQASATVAGAS